MLAELLRNDSRTEKAQEGNESDGKKSYAAVVGEMCARQEAVERRPQGNKEEDTGRRTKPTASREKRTCIDESPKIHKAEAKSQNIEKTRGDGWTTIQRNIKGRSQDEISEVEGEEFDIAKPIFMEFQQHCSEDENDEDESNEEDTRELLTRNVNELDERVRRWAALETEAEHLQESEATPQQPHTTLGELRTASDWITETRIRINNLKNGEGKQLLKGEMKKVVDIYKGLLKRAKGRSKFDRHRNARQVKRREANKKEKDLQTKRDAKAVKAQEDEERKIKEGMKDLQEMAKENQRVESTAVLISNKFAGADIIDHGKDSEGNLTFTLELLEKLEDVPFFIAMRLTETKLREYMKANKIRQPREQEDRELTMYDDEKLTELITTARRKIRLYHTRFQHRSFREIRKEWKREDSYARKFIGNFFPEGLDYETCEACSRNAIKRRRGHTPHVGKESTTGLTRDEMKTGQYMSMDEVPFTRMKEEDEDQERLAHQNTQGVTRKKRKPFVGYGGTRCSVILSDMKTEYIWIAFSTHTKCDDGEFRRMLLYADHDIKQHNGPIDKDIPRYLRADNAFVNQKSKGHTGSGPLTLYGRMIQDNGMKITNSTPGRHWQVSVENDCRELRMEQRKLITDMNLQHKKRPPEKLEPFALQQAALLRNIMPRKRKENEEDEDNRSPWEKMTGKEFPKEKLIRRFGCPCWVTKEHRVSKGDERAREGIHLGVSANMQGWLIYIKESDSVVISQDVVFAEFGADRTFGEFEPPTTSHIDTAQGDLLDTRGAQIILRGTYDRVSAEEKNNQRRERATTKNMNRITLESMEEEEEGDDEEEIETYARVNFVTTAETVGWEETTEGLDVEEEEEGDDEEEIETYARVNFVTTEETVGWEETTEYLEGSEHPEPNPDLMMIFDEKGEERALVTRQTFEELAQNSMHNPKGEQWSTTNMELKSKLAERTRATREEVNEWEIAQQEKQRMKEALNPKEENEEDSQKVERDKIMTGSKGRNKLRGKDRREAKTRNGKESELTEDHMEIFQILAEEEKSMRERARHYLPSESYSPPRFRHKMLRDVMKPHYLNAESTEMENLTKKEFVEYITEEQYQQHLKDGGNKAVPFRWAYDIKMSREDPSEILRFKARLTLRGDLQKDKFKPHEKYAPVASPTSVRIFNNFCVNEGMEMRQYDVPVAFLNANPSRNTIGLPIPGYTVYDDQGRPMYPRLLKNLYGSVEAAKRWYDMTVEFFKSRGFTQLVNEETCFIHKERKIAVIIYVDDFSIAAKREGDRKWIEKDMIKEFDIRLEGDLNNYLGARYTKTAHGYFVDQEARIEGMAKRLGIPKQMRMFTPYITGENFDHTKLTKDRTQIDNWEEKYGFDLPGIVGELLYIAKASRPDIIVATSAIASHVAYTSEEVFRAARRVIQYLQTTKKRGLHITATTDDTKIRVFVDASYMSERNCHGHSRFGYVAMIGNNLIDWKSAYLPKTHTSTTAAEYHALNIAAMKAMEWAAIHNEMTEIFGSPEKKCDIAVGIDPTTTRAPRTQQEAQVIMMEDNKPAAMAAQSSRGTTFATRQMAASFWKLQEYVRKGQLEIDVIPTKRQIADFFTKTRITAKRFRILREFFVRKLQYPLPPQGIAILMGDDGATAERFRDDDMEEQDESTRKTETMEETDNKTMEKEEHGETKKI